MGLYDRNYFELTTNEELIVKKLLKKEKVSGFITAKNLMAIPPAYFFYSSHFPNNMLDTTELKNKASIKILKKFKLVLNKAEATERSIQSFISNQKAFFIIGSILAHYDVGHHGGFLFPEFPLSNNHVADYLIIGKNSGGHEFIFVELEAPNGMITKKDGSLGDSIRRGIKQVEDWESWLEKYYGNLKSFLDKKRNKKNDLPSEFFEYDKSRIHFVVVAGRRTDYKEATYRKRRRLLKDSDIRLMHYDNLIDSSLSVISAGSYCRSL